MPTWVRLAQACVGMHVPWANRWRGSRGSLKPAVAGRVLALPGWPGTCLCRLGWCMHMWVRLMQACMDMCIPWVNRGRDGRGSLRWPAAGHVLACSYVGQASAGMRGHARTVGEWAARWQGEPQAACSRPHPGAAWVAWHIPMQIGLAQACMGMCIPWANRQARWQGEPQVASSRPCQAGTGMRKHAHTVGEWVARQQEEPHVASGRPSRYMPPWVRQCRHAHTVGEWAGEAAGGASGGQRQATSWRMPTQVRQVHHAGMHYPMYDWP